MVNISLDTSALDDLDKYPSRLTNAIRAEMQRQMDETISYAKVHHRHETRTGRLNDAIAGKVDQDGLGAEIYFDSSKYGSKYAKYVHDGHRGWAPDRFLDEAVQDRENDIQTGFDRAVQEALK